jgi:hypothetical protein
MDDRTKLKQQLARIYLMAKLGNRLREATSDICLDNLPARMRMLIEELSAREVPGGAGSEAR